jgi:two-component system response regulator
MTNVILVIEDSDDDYVALTRVFKNAGLRNQVLRCDCGDHALACLLHCRESAAQKPGLILLDLNLPGIDGREVLRALKADPHLRQIPVIVLTSSVAREDITRCYEAGADSYLFKPVDMEGFIQSVERLKECWQGAFELDFEPR